MRRKCTLLGLSRGRIYYQPTPENEQNFMLKKEIERLYTAYPFFGYRKVTAVLRRDGHDVNRKRVRRLMREMGLMAIYCKPNLSRPNRAHKIYPYLLKNLSILRPNHVWATDITYLKIAGKNAYLVAIFDWYSRHILAWELSWTMETDFCISALTAAFEHGTPEIFNSDQGSQFTSETFILALTAAGIRISMDGKGSYQDNIRMERVWRSVKYEEVYLKEYVSMEAAKLAVSAYVEFYNTFRPHQNLGYKTPAEIHFALAEKPPVDMMDNIALRSMLPTYAQAQPQQKAVA
jgi:putative transposase